MLKWLFSTVFLLAGLSNLFAQVVTDSIKKTDTIPITVLNTYILRDYQGYDFTAGIRTYTLSPTLLRDNSSISGLSDALQTVGGVYMRSYGNGMNNAVTLRGFGPERTSTLWNGIPINNAGLGQLDMNLMPGGFFNSIKLIEGSSSTQYGNGAQGGSLLLEYHPDFNNKFNITLQQEFGSFFSWNTGVQTNYGNKIFQGRTAFLRNSSNNNYAYKDKATVGFPTKETVNANFFSYQIIQDLFFSFKKNWNLSFHGWFNYTDRRIPPPLGAANNNSQQFDQNIRLMTQLWKQIRFHGIKLQVAYLQDHLNFRTDAFNDSSLIHSGQVQLQYTYSSSKVFALISGGNFSVNYSEYQYYGNPITEFRGNVFIMTNWRFRSKSRITQAKLSAGMRQQLSTHYISYPSAHIGMDLTQHIKEGHSITACLAFNTAYRMPTLNDLYWVPGGNPNLKPEYSWNTEASFKYKMDLPWIDLSFDVMGYFGRTSNWIQWTPTIFGYWEPQNLTEVQSAGFEGGASFSLKKKKWKLNLQGHYNFTHATDVNNNFYQLIYVPQHSVKGTLELKWDEIYLTILPSFYSKRFTLSDNTQFIPSFFLLNLQAGYTLKLTSCAIGFFGRLNNVTHADYQMVLNRPMPGINFSAGINFYLDIQPNRQRR